MSAAVGFNLRRHPQVRRAAAVLRDGAVGPVLAASALSTGFAKPPGWKTTRPRGGTPCFAAAQAAIASADCGRPVPVADAPRTIVGRGAAV